MPLEYLNPTFSPLATLLVVSLFAWLVYTGWTGRDRFARWAQESADDGVLSRYYLAFIVRSGLLLLTFAAVLATGALLYPAELGLRWPQANGLDFAIAFVFLLAVLIGAIGMRKRIRQGHSYPARAATSLLVPRTTGQRWLVLAFSAAAGVAEEAVYRGLFIAAAAGLLGLSVIPAAVLALALFVFMHRYQGRAGMFSVAYLGAILTVLYVISGSLLVPILLHTAQNVIALLLIPANPPGPPPSAPSHDDDHDGDEPAPPALAEPRVVTGAPTLRSAAWESNSPEVP